MTNYIIRRLMIAAFTVFMLTLVTFVLLRVSPGSPCIGGFMTKEACDALKEEQGWNKPYFPISFTDDTSDLMVLLLPFVAAVAVFGAWRWRAAR